MIKQLSIGVLLMTIALHAQNGTAAVTTTSAQVSGLANCQQVSLNVTQQTTGGSYTVTTLNYRLTTCATSTQAATIIAEGIGTIPNGDYQVVKGVHTLISHTVANGQGAQGNITLTWQPAGHSWTFSGSWVERESNQIVSRSTQDTVRQTASVAGSIAGVVLNGDRAGQVSQDQVR